jgi:pyrimidine operon attenuation protein / uracil phosphoribosyltransferase
METDSVVNIMNQEHIFRSVRRMAMQILEDHKSNQKIAVIGLNTRGFQLGTFIAKEITKTSKLEVDCFQYEVGKSNASDLLDHIQSIDYAILVDDVLFSGSTMMLAIRDLLNIFEPKALRIAVLVDRGHRRFPIQPDFTGIHSPTKFREHVEVHFSSEGIPTFVELSQQ